MAVWCRCEGKGECLGCLIDKTVKEFYGTLGVEYVHSAIQQREEEYNKVYDLMMACREDLMRVTGITKEGAAAELSRRAIK